MFTGIITHLGTISAKTKNGLTITASGNLIKQLLPGSSVSVNGVCLTVTGRDNRSSFSINIMPETWEKTALGDLKPSNPVNLELPSSPSSLLSGHIVQGHVDGTALIGRITPEGNSHIFDFTTAPKLTKYLVEKGSVAVNGISLTVIKVNKQGFRVGIISHTLTNTMLSHAVVGSKVNIEVDIIAKYLYKFAYTISSKILKK